MTNRPDEDAPALLPPADVMHRLGVSRKTLVRWDDNGQLKAIRLPSGHRRYRVDDVEAIERGEAATA